MPVLIDNVKMKDSLGVERTVIDTNGKLYLAQIAGGQYFVDSATGSDSNDGGSWSEALATLDAAIAKCAANNGDVIWVAPGHTETYTTTGAKLIVDVAGVTIIGLGEGAARPTFNFGHTGATWTISAANAFIQNLLIVTAVDQVVTYATISGVDCTLADIETRDVTDKEVVDAFITTAAADRLKVFRHFHNGYTGGDANDRVWKLVGVDNALFDGCRFMTKVTTAVINFATTPCTNVVVKNCEFLVTSTTDFTKTVVDTVTGSTWLVRDCFDLAAGSFFSGGSGGALAGDDVAAVTTAIAAVQTDIGDPSARTNLQSLLALLGNPDTAGATLWSKIYAGRQYATKSVATVANGATTLFNYTGSIRIISIIGRVTTAIQNQATAVKLQVVSDALAAYDICATKDIDNFAIGSMLSITGTAANAMLATTGVGVLAPIQDGVVGATCVTAGTIVQNSAAASTGAITWEILWEPLSAGASVTAA